jgi:glycosyltransferase involved in cell wall biosynthesis
MLKAVLGAISTTLKNRSYLVVVLAYPYAIPRVQAILEYISSLLVLKVLSLGRIKVVVDDFDPPVEAAYAFEAQPSAFVIACKRILDMSTLKLASFVVTVSESFKHHIARLYRIEERRMFVVSNGSLVRYINSTPSMSEGYLRILYSGSAMKSKDVDKLVLAVGELKKKSSNVLLVLTGSKSMDIPTSEWIVHKKVDNWISYVKNFLETSDICVIPYPHSLFWDYTTLAKLFDYMAAGKAVISTDLKETGKIIRMFNCGLVARSWKEFELCLERLYHDRELTRKLGENGRRAAQKYFDYELLAEAFLEKLLDTFKPARCMH